MGSHNCNIYLYGDVGADCGLNSINTRFFSNNETTLKTIFLNDKLYKGRMEREWEFIKAHDFGGEYNFGLHREVGMINCSFYLLDKHNKPQRVIF